MAKNIFNLFIEKNIYLNSKKVKLATFLATPEKR
jgi:hypothetical protein